MITTEPSVGVAGTDQLRRVLDAVLLIGSDLDLTATLQRITETAAHLVGATRGSLRVLDESKTALVEVVTVGFADEAQGVIGELHRSAASSEPSSGTRTRFGALISEHAPADPEIGRSRQRCHRYWPCRS